MSTNARILLVDDETVNLRVLDAMLRSRGFTNVVSLREPAEVLEEVKKAPPDLILMDLNMPGTDGYAVMQQLASARDSGVMQPMPPVVVLTGYADQERIQRATEAGARGYLVKPVDLDQLDSVVRTVLTGQDNGDD